MFCKNDDALKKVTIDYDFLSHERTIIENKDLFATKVYVERLEDYLRLQFINERHSDIYLSRSVTMILLRMRIY